MNKTLSKEQKSSIKLLLLSKMFERMAFYLLMSILMIFIFDSYEVKMTTAGYYYSIFYGVIGFTTLFSGLLGDLTNRMRVVIIGFIILSIMYLVLAFLPSINILLIISLITLGLGIGLVSPNIVVLFGSIYTEKGDEIIGLSGFILFSIVVNIGALFAPVISNILKDSYGYSSIFIVTSLLGFVSFMLFLKFKNHYNKLNIDVEQDESMDLRRIHSKILISILVIGVLTAISLNQRGLTFGFAIRDYLHNGMNFSNNITGIENILSTLLLLLFFFIISKIGKFNWQKVFNIVLIGLTASAIAYILVASFNPLSSLINEQIIFIQSYILLIVAETLIYPIFSYIVYRSSPLKYKGLFQGISYFTLAVSNSLLFLGVSLYEINNTMAFIVFASILLLNIILVIVLKRIINLKITILHSNNIK